MSPGEKCQNKKGVVNLSAPDKMPIEIKKEIQLEIAHVLFVDIVGYSKLSINDQHAAVEELNRVVRASEQFQRAEAASRLLKIPTGDGMVLVFYTSPEAPVQCAVEISRSLKEHPRLQVRMGIHSGPVSGVVDLNERANLAGAGLNMAKRVMDCGDAGHILLSKRVAEDLEQYDKWRPLLHDLGSCEVKHGVRVSVAGSPCVIRLLFKCTEQTPMFSLPILNHANAKPRGGSTPFIDFQGSAHAVCGWYLDKIATCCLPNPLWNGSLNAEQIVT